MTFETLPVRRLTQLLPIHSETARRWRRRRRIPPVPLLALQLKIEGDLSLISPTWSGWTLKGDKLTTPEGITWTAPQLNAWHWERQLLAELSRQAKTPRQFTLV
ncbi:MAG: DUF3653 domain-containing protein [Gammaproteobacteria bacterium]